MHCAPQWRGAGGVKCDVRSDNGPVNCRSDNQRDRPRVRRPTPYECAGLPARSRTDRSEGRLRRRRMRGLRDHGRPPRRIRWNPLDLGQLLPAAGGSARRGRGRDLRRSGRRRLRPPRPGRDGRARRIPMRILHPRLHLLDGRRILPPRPLRGRLRPSLAVGQPVPLHRLPPHPRCRERPRTAGGRRSPGRPP